MDELSLIVPAKTREWPSDLGSRRARGWVAQLPLADSVEAARQIYRTLFHLNRSALDPDSRFELMGLYAAPVAAVSEQLARHLERFELPLAGSKRKLADFLRELHLEMAYGYKNVVQEVSSRRRKRHEELLPEAIERAIYYLGQVLARSYRTYLPAPAGTWREIHSLYTYAEGLHIEGASEQAAGPRASYVRILLLGISGPYQLTPEESGRAEDILALCAHRTVIREADPRVDRHPRFIVDLRSDAPPAWSQVETIDPMRRLMDVSAVVAFLSRATHRIRLGEPARRVGIRIEMLDGALLNLVERLTQFIGSPAGRRHRRIKTDRVLSVAAGFGAAHYFVSGQAGVESTLGNRVRLFRQQLDALEPDILGWKSFGTAEQEPRHDSFRLDNWVVRDQGPSGLALTRESAQPLDLRSGGLVILGAERGAWEVGIVRWVKSPSPSRVEMGIELLPGVPEAAYIEGPAERWSALILAGKQKLRVLVASDDVVPGQMVRLVRAGMPSEWWRVADGGNSGATFAFYDLVPATGTAAREQLN